MNTQSFILLISFLIIKVFAFDASSSNNVAVYWGQDSYGSEESLDTYCESDDVDIVLLSFLYNYPNNLGYSFSSKCSSDSTSGCLDVGSSIKKCQSNNKLVLLSLGGASGSYSLSSDQEGEDFADTLWKTFGNGDGGNKPFGDDVSVDGFDFDLENKQQTGTAALAKALRSKFDEDSSKTYYLSAAPQCVYPDESVGDILKEAQIDFAFIQFYNNPCSLDKSFNWDTWTDFASNDSPNKDIKLFIGLPGASSSAGSGYIAPNQLSGKITSDIKSNKNFGGISLWDASSAFGNKDGGNTFASSVKQVLGGSSSGSSSGSGSSSSSSSSSTSTSASTSTGTTGTTSSANTNAASSTQGAQGQSQGQSQSQQGQQGQGQSQGQQGQGQQGQQGQGQQGQGAATSLAAAATTYNGGASQTAQASQGVPTTLRTMTVTNTQYMTSTVQGSPTTLASTSTKTYDDGMYKGNEYYMTHKNDNNGQWNQ